MERIKKGDWVICIDISGPASLNHAGKLLRLHKEYLVENTLNCTCGFLMLDVGLNSPNCNYVRCNNCGCKIPANGVYWCKSTRFTKKKKMEASNQKENINIILKPKEILKEQELIAN